MLDVGSGGSCEAELEPAGTWEAELRSAGSCEAELRSAGSCEAELRSAGSCEAGSWEAEPWSAVDDGLGTGVPAVSDRCELEDGCEAIMSSLLMERKRAEFATQVSTVCARARRVADPGAKQQ
jgi:hypothetical protein